MNLVNRGNSTRWLPWVVVTLLAASCCVLAVLQFRWITEFSAAERDRVRADLQSRLILLSKNFNDEISEACRALIPSASDIEKNGRERAYTLRFSKMPPVDGNTKALDLFRRIALVLPNHEAGTLTVESYDEGHTAFQKSAWPPEWSGLRTRLESRLKNPRTPPLQPEAVDPSASTTMVFPRVAYSPDWGGVREQEWLIVELNEDYIRGTLLPAEVKKYLGEQDGLNYETEVTLNADPSHVIYASDQSNVTENADASAPLFSVQLRLPSMQVFHAKPRPQFGPPRDGRGPDGRGRGHGPDDRNWDGHERGFGRRGPPPDGFGPPRDGRPPEMRGRRGPPPPPVFNPPPEPPEPRQFADARWRLFVRHRGGSIEALATRARNRNILISGGLLLLILTIVGWLMQLSRQSQRLAESHMNFVAGVSHELRTPLTVIRTAAYNLRGKLSNRPDQVEKYGKLIQEESEKLGALVEQVLQFASAQAGHVTRAQEATVVDDLIDESIRWNIETLGSRGIELEKKVEPGLPMVLADRLAMKHALRNLVDNALKYGTESSPWIGIFARAAKTSKGAAVEIRIADRGPGIPADEQAHIFDPFFRGRRALSDQVHGTGLGLNLARRIVEAHGGTLGVESKEGAGTEFVVRLPAVAESQAVRAGAGEVSGATT